MRVSCFFCALLMVFPAVAEDLVADKITLRGVDKITGRVQTMDARIGDTITFGKLKINPVKCLTAPVEEAPENKAFLSIYEDKKQGTFESVFNGWMFSSNPALSAMEHPVYDVWVIKCTPAKPEPIELPKAETLPTAKTVQIQDLPVEEPVTLTDVPTEQKTESSLSDVLNGLY